MKKSFLITTAGVLSLMFIIEIISGPFSSRALAEATTPPPSGDDEIHRCDYKNNVCLGSATYHLCQGIEKLTIGTTSGTFWTNNGKTGTQKLCQIPKKQYSFSKYLGAWINVYLFNLGLAVGLVLILFAGVLYMMSGTDPGKANTAKDIIFTALVGLLLIFLVKIIFTVWIF